MNILIVDDHKSISGMFSKYLTLHDHNVTETNESKEGLDLMLKKKYDIVMLDLAMPGLSGYDILDILEKKHELVNQNIVIFTASAASDIDLIKLKKRGVKETLRKPVSLATLNQVITNVSNQKLVS